MFSAKVLKDSVGPAGTRLTTFQLTYPLFVHAHLLTHRVFSRNSASSRAIPVQKTLSEVKANPAVPVFWGKNQPGMQADEELPYAEKVKAEASWLKARQQALYYAERMHNAGVHKQIANRTLEPWMWATVIVSSTSYANWFRLRNHKDAQPEIRTIAAMMSDEYRSSTPEELEEGEWHLPMLDDRAKLEVEGYDIKHLKDISVGRVARVSYLTHEGVRDPQKDIELGLRLARAGHYSPFEHVAMALSSEFWNYHIDVQLRKAQLQRRPFNPMLFGNLVGWHQYRKDLKDEHGFEESLSWA